MQDNRPLIAITGNYSDGMCTLLEGYFASLTAVGASPVIVPPYADEALMESLLEHVDAIVFSGGGDIDPHLLGEEPLPEVEAPNMPRDAQELPLVRMAARRQMPILGICRGIQVLTAALGGKLWQDIYVQGGATLTHSQGDIPRHIATHTVSLLPGTKLAGILGASPNPLLKEGATNLQSDGEDSLHPASVSSTPLPYSSEVPVSDGFPSGISEPRASENRTMLASALPSTAEIRVKVNTFHHQAVREAAPGFRVSALAPDGIIEAVESAEGKPIIGVQWHPECMVLGGDESMLPLFRWLTDEAMLYARTRRFHNRHLTLDTHCDTPMLFPQHIDFFSRDPRILVNLPAMTDGRLDATIMAAYIPQDLPGAYDYASARTLADSLLDGICRIATSDPSRLALARTPAELFINKEKAIKSILPAIENGYAIGDDLNLITHWRQRGVVYMTLCHNGNNAICASARPREHEPTFTHRGLSDFGHKVVHEMNRTGMMVDLSHASEQSFYDAISVSSTPIVCSHSSCRVLCDHPRNLTDDQLRALRDCGGVVQITLYNAFLRAGGGATVDDAVRHILHAINIAGIDHVGIGTDFDGDSDSGIPGCANAAELPNITRRLLAEGLTSDDLAKFWGGNFLRVMTQVQEV
jgi:microsomal dipeptidase-like Zn-dependent dipeptidase/gamma-glutamyl-gamma-aminobutyrate hydrolase PuuD